MNDMENELINDMENPLVLQDTFCKRSLKVKGILTYTGKILEK